MNTPRLLLDLPLLEQNIRGMQATALRHGIGLWPHVKTHKSVEVARRQLRAGAEGLTCAKLGEAEAILPCGVERLFVAYPLGDPEDGPRLRRLADDLEELILAVTSAAQAEALESVLRREGLCLPVLMAADSGLGREGVRSVDEGLALIRQLQRSRLLQLRGVYTHEGHCYRLDPPAVREEVDRILTVLNPLGQAIETERWLWPGCSVTADRIAAAGIVRAVRPGAYVFGDLYLAEDHEVLAPEACALSVLTRVVDEVRDGLVLLDAGSKTLGTDRSAQGIIARDRAIPARAVTRCSEEHGIMEIGDAPAPRLNERLKLLPAHVCPVVNLADHYLLSDGDEIVGEWRIEARGRVR